MKLFYNPVSSYSQKVLMALAEKGIPFTPEVINVFTPGWKEAHAARNPFAKIPVLETDDGQFVFESPIIIEYLEGLSQAVPLIPADRDQARAVRFWDRFADLYLNDTMQKIFFDGRKPVELRDPRGVEAAQATLDKAYPFLNAQLEKTPWLAGETFSMADCAAAPCLFYLSRVHPFAQYPAIAAYAQRVTQRESYQKILQDAAPLLARMG